MCFNSDIRIIVNKLSHLIHEVNFISFCHFLASSNDAHLAELIAFRFQVGLTFQVQLLLFELIYFGHHYESVPLDISVERCVVFLLGVFRSDSADFDFVGVHE